MGVIFSRITKKRRIVRVLTDVQAKPLLLRSHSITDAHCLALESALSSYEAGHFAGLIIGFVYDYSYEILTRALPLPNWIGVATPRKRNLVIGLFGASGSGSSMLIHSYLGGGQGQMNSFWSSEYKQTCRIDNVVFDVNIADTTGQEEFDGIQDTILLQSQIILLVFSPSNRKTFDYIQEFYDKYIDTLLSEEFSRGEKCAILVSSKDTSNNDKNDECQVHHNEALLLARKWNMPYIPSSPISGKNVDTVFVEAIREYVNRRRLSLAIHS